MLVNCVVNSELVLNDQNIDLMLIHFCDEKLIILKLKFKLMKYVTIELALHKLMSLSFLKKWCYSCRIKRIEQKDELETEKSQEYQELDDLQHSNNMIRSEVENTIRQFEMLKRFAASNKVMLPLELQSL